MEGEIPSISNIKVTHTDKTTSIVGSLTIKGKSYKVTYLSQTRLDNAAAAKKLKDTCLKQAIKLGYIANKIELGQADKAQRITSNVDLTKIKAHYKNRIVDVHYGDYKTEIDATVNNLKTLILQGDNLKAGEITDFIKSEDFPKDKQIAIEIYDTHYDDIKKNDISIPPGLPVSITCFDKQYQESTSSQPSSSLYASSSTTSTSPPSTPPSTGINLMYAALTPNEGPAPSSTTSAMAATNKTAETTTGIQGFPNVGTSCYMNSALQVAFNDPTLRKLIANDKWPGIENETNETKKTDAETFKAIVQRLAQGNVETDDLKNLKGLFCKQYRLDETKQQDSIEFLRHLTQLTGYSDSTKGEATVFPISIENNDAQQSYDAFFEKTSFKGNSPQTLVLQFNRFGIENNKKNSDPLTFPDKLNIKGTSYEVTSFIHHAGDTIDSGHYVSYIKKDNQWIKADDSNTTFANEAEVNKALSESYVVTLSKTETTKAATPASSSTTEVPSKTASPLPATSPRQLSDRIIGKLNERFDGKKPTTEDPATFYAKLTELPLLPNVTKKEIIDILTQLTKTTTLILRGGKITSYMISELIPDLHALNRPITIKVYNADNITPTHIYNEDYSENFKVIDNDDLEIIRKDSEGNFINTEKATVTIKLHNGNKP